MLLLAFACSGDKDSGDGPGTTGEASGCDPLVPEVCALPWPSDLFETEDPSTPTGLRLSFGPTTLPMNRDFVQTQPDMLNDKDGYSTLGPMVVYLDGVALDGTIGHDDLEAYLAADAKTVIVDTLTHERVPHFVELDMSTDDPSERVLFLRPVVPLEHGRRYVVGLRNLVGSGGAAVEPSEAFRALRDDTSTSDPDVESRRERFESLVVPELEGQGFARGELQLAWTFHTGSREWSLGKVLAMRDDALARTGGAPPYVIDSVEEHDCAYESVARTVNGHFTAPRYTDTDAPGARLTRGDDGLPTYNGDTSVPFMVRVPCSVWNDPQGGARILQYGHGLLGDLSEARTGWLSDFANANRYVVLAQNWTGMSTWDAGFVTLMLTLDVSDFPAIPERTQQGFVEFAVGLELARGALATDGALERGGQPVIDPTLVPVYYGNSQGAILGGAYFALSPTIERGVLGVGGMPYALLLSRSADFDPFFLVFKEKFEDHRDIALLIAAFQTVWDPGESAGYAHALARDPLPGTPAKQVLLQVAIGDAQVTTLGAHVAARAYGAASVAPANRPIWGVPETSAPFTGSAIVEWLYEDGASEPYENLPPDVEADTHECPRREPAGQAQVVAFFETGTIEQHCDGPCTGTRAGFCD